MPGTIIIVDDNESILETTEALLSDAGYVVRTTLNPFALPRLLRAHAPNLVLVDFDMPQIAGGHLTRMFHGAYARTVFLLFSGKPARELESLAREYGAAGYVQKGSSPVALLREIRRWMAQSIVSERP